MNSEPPQLAGTNLTGSLPPRSAGSLYEFVRSYLRLHSGSCTRSQLLSAIEADDVASTKLRQSRSFNALLSNMKHSGFITLDGEMIRATARKLGRRRP